jgi:hypothetical protein
MQDYVPYTMRIDTNAQYGFSTMTAGLSDRHQDDIRRLSAKIGQGEGGINSPILSSKTPGEGGPQTPTTDTGFGEGGFTAIRRLAAKIGLGEGGVG